MFLLIQRLPQRTSFDQLRLAAIRDHLGWPGRVTIDTAEALRVFHPKHFLKTCLAMRPITAIVICLLVAGPWYYWVGLRTDGAWLRGFFLEHNFQRATHAMEGHSGPFFYYPVMVLAFTFPWSIFAVPTLIDAVRRLRNGDGWNDGLVFALCWAFVYVGLFTLATTKLPSYITPMYPAAAIIYGGFMYRWSKKAVPLSKLWSAAPWFVLALVGLGMIVAFPLVARHFVPGEEWMVVLGLIPLLGAIVGWHYVSNRRPARAARTLAVVSVLFATMLFGVAAVRISKHQDYGTLVSAIHDRSESPEIATFGCMEPSWVFYSEETIEKHGVKEEGVKGIESHLQEQGEDAIIITTRSHYEKTLHDALGDRLVILSEAPYFLKDETLIVLAPGNPIAGEFDPNERVAEQAGDETIRR